ncbi:MAG: pilus (MSHA type) biogenesis protein MshL [Burkholderiales bacterium]|nr:pilus (MSHA type) biogenesis protein MshL [Burkholderiales bacterium]
MMRTVGALLLLTLAGCSIPPRPNALDPALQAALDRPVQGEPAPRTDERAASQALIPPLRVELPKVEARPVEQRFDLAVANAPAQQVFMAIVSGTRFSMLVHPDVSSAISVNLKDVTVAEALEALRELYGFEYRIDGTRIFVQSAGMRTHVFQVNYLIGQRIGRSDVRVTSGSVADAPVTTSAGGVAVPQPAPALATPGAPGSPTSLPGRVTESSRVQTSTRTDFWDELRETVRSIVGSEGGRMVIVNPQANVLLVKAMPQEIRQVEAYLKAIQVAVDRQVMLEAKIVEVELGDQFQAGINWASFPSSGFSAGLVRPGSTLQTTGALTSPNLTANPAGRSITNTSADNRFLQGIAGFTNFPGVSLFGLALQTGSFAALLEFLAGQGSVQVLSSPRIATLNNQKAVLKVGSDEFFITNVTGGSTGTTTAVATGGTTTFPTLTLQPFFSGVALDITPQIDDQGMIVLHIHPQVSEVVQQDRTVNLGQVFGGQVTLPLARSTVSETDSIVKVADSNIVAIGGLMKVSSADQRTGMPWLQDIPGIGHLFATRARVSVKKELVILIKPTVIRTGVELAEDVAAARERMIEMLPPAPSRSTPWSLP